MPFTLASLPLFLIIGITFFAVAVIALIIFFNISTADLLKKPREMVLLLLISLALPVSLAGLSDRTGWFIYAGSDITVIDARLTRITPSQIIVEFHTDRPAFGYLEYLEPHTQIYLPVLPAYPLSLRTSHVININNASLSSVWIVINGRRLEELKITNF